MRFPPSLLDEIRARLPVSQVVGRRVQLKRQGREFIGLSPFKVEKSPSFTVNDQKGFYHCFATGEHGDIFTFLMKTEGLGFPEAVERLAGEAGVVMPKLTHEAERSETERRHLHDVTEACCAFFEAQLAGPAGREARAYLDRRAVPAALQRAFRMGFAPDGRTALMDHLTKAGFVLHDIVRAGMLVAGPDIPTPYDRFRNRLIIPITDPKGRVIAFGGRTLSPDGKPKYLNSPETPLFHKGAILFNAARARQAAHDAGTVIVVEGYMDVVALAGAGIAHGVAPLGTALTEHQLKLLWRMAAEPILCFDGDSAGQKAAHRAIDVALPLLAPGFSLRFAFLPQGQDPDDLVRAEGPEALRTVLDGAQPLAGVLWARELASGDWSTPERRAQLDQRLRALMTQIADPGVRAHYQQAMSERLGKLWGAVSRTGGKPGAWAGKAGQARRWQPPGGPARGRGPGGSWVMGTMLTAEPSASLKLSALVRGGAEAAPEREALLVRTLLNHPWLLDDFAEDVAALRIKSRMLAGLRDAILGLHAEKSPLDSDQLATHLDKSGFGDALSLVSRANSHRSDRFAEPGAAAEDVVAGWRHAFVLQQKIELIDALSVAERAWMSEGSDEALAQLTDIKVRLQAMEAGETLAHKE